MDVDENTYTQHQLTQVTVSADISANNCAIMNASETLNRDMDSRGLQMERRGGHKETPSPQADDKTSTESQSFGEILLKPKIENTSDDFSQSCGYVSENLNGTASSMEQNVTQTNVSLFPRLNKNSNNTNNFDFSTAQSMPIYPGMLSDGNNETATVTNLAGQYAAPFTASHMPWLIEKQSGEMYIRPKDFQLKSSSTPNDNDNTNRTPSQLLDNGAFVNGSSAPHSSHGSSSQSLISQTSSTNVNQIPGIDSFISSNFLSGLEKKRRELTIRDKLDVINASEGKSQRQLAAQFNICKSQVHNILKRKNEIKETFCASPAPERKRRFIRTENEDVNLSTLEWYVSQREGYISVTGAMIQRKARELAQQMGKKDFKASNGWLESFRKRHNIGPFNMTSPSLESFKSELEHFNASKNLYPCASANSESQNLNTTENYPVSTTASPFPRTQLEGDFGTANRSSEKLYHYNYNMLMNNNEKIALTERCEDNSDTVNGEYNAPEDQIHPYGVDDVIA